MKQVVIGFGLLITALLILFKIASLYHLYSAANDDIWIAAFSVLFLVIGILLSRKLFVKTHVVTKQKPSEINQRTFVKIGLEQARG